MIYPILISLVLGLGAGILGTAWTSSYLSDYAVQLNELTAPLRLSAQKPRNFPSSYKEAVDDFVSQTLPSVVQVYRDASGALGYRQDEADRVGMVLTTDGWVGIESGRTAPASLMESRIHVNNQWLSVQAQKFDPVTGIIFVKVEADHLPVVSLGKGREAHRGEQVFVVEDAAGFVVASVKGEEWAQDGSVSSDEPNRLLTLDRDVQPGSLVFNLSGEVIGLVRTDHAVLPIEAMTPSFKSLLEHQTISRPTLGVMAVDLSHGLDISATLTSGHTTGALLYGSGSLVRSGAARQAGLKPSDIILSVNDESVDASHTLDELIEQYRPGDQVRLQVERAKVGQTITVTLGERAP